MVCALRCVCALQKNAIAVAHCKRGKGVLNINGYPIDGLLPESMRYKVFEPVLLIGNDKFKDVDIRVRVRGGGNTSQIFGEFPFCLVFYCILFCWSVPVSFACTVSCRRMFFQPQQQRLYTAIFGMDFPAAVWGQRCAAGTECVANSGTWVVIFCVTNVFGWGDVHGE